MTNPLRYRPISLTDIWMGRLFLPSFIESNPLWDISAIFSFVGDLFSSYYKPNERTFLCSAPYPNPYSLGRCYYKVEVQNKIFPEKCERCGNYFDWIGRK